MATFVVENPISKKLKFTIHGNQEDKTGNPIPYLRTTQKSQWTDNAQRYHAWKGHVRAQYIDAVKALTGKERELFSMSDLLNTKPIPATKQKICMVLNITWKNDARGDCDNVFKGIADALFANDKYLVGSFDYEYSTEGKGKVDVTLFFT